MRSDVKKRIISHKQLTTYEEACIIVLVLLGIHAFVSWTGLLSLILPPTTDGIVFFVYMLFNGGIPIILGVIGLIFGTIGLVKLKKKKTASKILKETIYIVTIFFSALGLLGSLGYGLLFVIL